MSKSVDEVLNYSKEDLQIIKRPYNQYHFLTTLSNDKSTRILDIGCGNSAVLRVKKVCDKCFYSGLDVQHYNMNEDGIEAMEEYVLVASEQFADEILRWENKEDAVIWSHNIEHCEKPDIALTNVCKSLKKGGRLYLSFPSEESVDFPKGYYGTLNFYDDYTHKTVPDWNDIITRLIQMDMEINIAIKNYQPIWEYRRGEKNLEESTREKKVMPGIWHYYGFESIIWAKKKK